MIDGVVGDALRHHGGFVPIAGPRDDRVPGFSDDARFRLAVTSALPPGGSGGCWTGSCGGLAVVLGGWGGRGSSPTGAVPDRDRLSPIVPLTCGNTSAPSRWMPTRATVCDRVRCHAVATNAYDGPGRAQKPSSPSPSRHRLTNSSSVTSGSRRRRRSTICCTTLAQSSGNSSAISTRCASGPRTWMPSSASAATGNPPARSRVMMRVAVRPPLTRDVACQHRHHPA